MLESLFENPGCATPLAASENPQTGSSIFGSGTRPLKIYGTRFTRSGLGE
jgi:hypothetical protein